MITATTTRRIVQVGTSKIGKTWVATCADNQPAAT